MEACKAAIMAYPLGHDKGTDISLKAVQKLGHEQREDDIGTGVGKAEDILSPEDMKIIKDRYFSGDSAILLMPSSTEAHTCVKIPPSAAENLSLSSVPEEETDRRACHDMSASDVPTYQTVPKLKSSDLVNSIHQAGIITMPRRNPLSRLSHHKLNTVIEHKPPTDPLVKSPHQGAVPSISIDKTDAVVASDDVITKISNMPLHAPSSRTSTMCSTTSANSHREPGPIHIHLSPQLQSMQSISELDARLNEATSLRNPWRMSRHNHTRSQQTYTPTGTPESISNVPLSPGLFEAHSRLNRNILSEAVAGFNKHDWARSCEWVEPCATDDESKEWIEDFLTRQEQADRDELRERQRQEKQDKRHAGLRGRVNSADKFRRRLSMKRVAGERGSFEARQERRSGSTFDLNMGSHPYNKATILKPEEDFQKPARVRALSWDPSTGPSLTSRTTVPNRLSWTPMPASSSPHLRNATERLHMSLPSRESSYRLSDVPLARNNHRSTSSQQPPPARQHYHTHIRTGSWEKLKVKAITSIGSDVKRTISTGFAPAVTDGKYGVKNLVEQVEKVGESVTRKLSTSLRGRWKGFSKRDTKDKSRNAGDMQIIERER